MQTIGLAAGVTGEGHTGAGGQVKDGVLGAGELCQHHVIGPHLIVVVLGAALSSQLVKKSAGACGLETLKWKWNGVQKWV